MQTNCKEKLYLSQTFNRCRQLQVFLVSPYLTHALVSKLSTRWRCGFFFSFSKSDTMLHFYCQHHCVKIHEQHALFSVVPFQSHGHLFGVLFFLEFQSKLIHLLVKMVRKLQYHEQKLLKKVDFMNWPVDNNLHEAKVMRKFHIRKREDYTK